MSIEWQEDLKTGIEKIDSQHKGIFSRFAEFREACEMGCANDEFANLVAYLEEYARVHFMDEEATLLDAGYPGLAEQKENHSSFLKEVAAFKDKIYNRKPEMVEIFEMQRLLIRWLIIHIKHQDMLYVDFLKSKETV